MARTFGSFATHGFASWSVHALLKAIGIDVNKGLPNPWNIGMMLRELATRKLVRRERFEFINLTASYKAAMKKRERQTRELKNLAAKRVRRPKRPKRR